jgi:hypothetical protein
MISSIPEVNPGQWCIKNPARKKFDQCNDKKVFYEYNGHGDRDTAAYCVKAIKEACTTKEGSVPPKYLSCVFNSCNTVDDNKSIESVLKDIQAQYPYLEWSVVGYPQTYFTDDNGNESDICQPRIKYTIGASGLNLEVPLCSEIIGHPTYQLACEPIETTICADDSDQSCPVEGGTLPMKTLYSCPDDPASANGLQKGEWRALYATWKEERCEEIPCHFQCYYPPHQETGCLLTIGPGEDMCEGCLKEPDEEPWVWKR